jgi:hypothetical protein
LSRRICAATAASGDQGHRSEQRREWLQIFVHQDPVGVDTIRRYATSRQKKRAQFGGARAGRIEELRPCRPNEDAAAFPESSKTKSNRSRVHGSAAARPLALPSAGFLADRLSANYLSADHPLTDAMHGFRRRILLLALAGGALIPGAEVARAMVKPTAPSGLSIGD